MAPIYSLVSFLSLSLLPHLVASAVILVNMTDPAVSFTISASDAALSAPTGSTESCDSSYWVNHLVFDVTLDDFIEYRNADNLSCISDWNWSSDGCSASPDELYASDFHDACLRHDFAYGGFSNLCMLDHDMRERVDRNFADDLEAQCEVMEGLDNLLCELARHTYYDAVRASGRLFAPECDPGHRRRLL